MLVQALDQRHFEKAPPGLAAGLEWWKNGYQRGDTFQSLLPNMQILHPCSEKGFFYSHVGATSTGARVFGTDWAMNCMGEPSTPCQSVENSANHAYSTVVDAPYYGEVSGAVLGYRYPLYVTYQRLIVPFELTPGHLAYGLFTEFTQTPHPVC